MRWMIVAALMIAGCKKSGSSCDMSTDKGAQGAYQRLTGKKSSEECVRRIEAFPGLAKVGGDFAMDAGCLDEIWIWKCERTMLDNPAAILQSVGWKTTDDAGREKIARDWLAIDAEVLFTADAEATDAFAKAGKTFVPATIIGKNGGVSASGWYRTSQVSVAGPLATYHQLATSFNTEGEQPDPVNVRDTFYGR